MATSNYDLTHYAFADDSGSSDPDTQTFDSEDTPRTNQAKEMPFFIRFQIRETGGKAGANSYWQLYYYTSADPASAIQVTTAGAPSAQIVDDPGSNITNFAATDTRVLSEYTGETYGAGEYVDAADDTNSKYQLDSSASPGYIELMWCVQFLPAAEDNQDYYFYPRCADSVMDTHAVHPKVTTAISSTVNVNINDNNPTVTDNATVAITPNLVNVAEENPVIQDETAAQITPYLTSIAEANPNVEDVVEITLLLGNVSVSVEEANPNVEDYSQVLVTLKIEVAETLGIEDAPSILLDKWLIEALEAIGIQDDSIQSVIAGGEVDISVFDRVHIHPAWRIIEPQENVTVGDYSQVSVSAIGNVDIDQNDTPAVTDAAVVQMPVLHIEAADDLAVTDAAVVQMPVLHIEAVDDLAVTEEKTVQISTVLVEGADNVGLSDEGILSIPVLHIRMEEVIQAIDEVMTSIPILIINVAENIGTQDEQTTALTMIAIETGDFITLSDEAVAQIPFIALKAFDQLVTMDEVQAELDKLIIGIFDPVTVQDYTNALRISANILYIDEGDNVEISEINEIQLTCYLVSEQENIELTDSAIAQIPILFLSQEQDITLSDEVMIQLVGVGVRTVQVADNVTLQEETSLAISVFKIAVSENITIQDAASISIPVFELAVYEMITLQDTVSISLSIFELAVYETVILNDQETLQVTSGFYEIAVAETISLSEASVQHILILIEEAIRIILSNEANITAIVEDRIFPMIIPQGIRGDTVLYQQISESEGITTEGALGLIESRWQLSCLTSTHVGSLTLAQAIRDGLEDYEGDVSNVRIAHVHVADEQDLMNVDEQAEALSRYGRMLDCEVSYAYAD